jgi:hypothetical protein
VQPAHGSCNVLVRLDKRDRRQQNGVHVTDERCVLVYVQRECVNIIRYYSNGTLYVPIDTEHYTLLFKRNILPYYSNGTLYVAIQTAHYTLLFKRNVIRYYSNGTVYITIQTEYYTLLFKRSIVHYYSN